MEDVKRLYLLVPRKERCSGPSVHIVGPRDVIFQCWLLTGQPAPGEICLLVCFHTGQRHAVNILRSKDRRFRCKDADTAQPSLVLALSCCTFSHITPPPQASGAFSPGNWQGKRNEAKAPLCSGVSPSAQKDLEAKLAG